MARLEAGEPLPYVLGQWPFYGETFVVNPHVLIPRPETELLVERALAWLKANPGRSKGVDVGAGSGCISVSIAKIIANIQLTAIDSSDEALAVCRENAQRHHVADRVHTLRSDLLQGFNGRVDLLCANLPYIPQRGGCLSWRFTAANRPQRWTAAPTGWI